MVYLSYRDRTATVVATETLVHNPLVAEMIDVATIGVAMSVRWMTGHQPTTAVTILGIIETSADLCRVHYRVVEIVETMVLRLPQQVHA